MPISWFKQGFWAVVDQALFAGTNFLVSLLLARWLDPIAYGAVSTVYSLLVLAGTLQSAFLLEPMIIYGPGRFKTFFGSYKRVLAKLNLVIAYILGSLFAFLGLLAYTRNSVSLALSFWGYALAIPAVFLFWLERQNGYVFLQPHRSAFSSALYLVLYLGIAWFLYTVSMLNSFSASVIAGISSYFSAKAVGDVKDRGEKEEMVTELKEAYILHWRYGRWAAITNILAWVPSYLPFLALSLFHGFGATASFRAVLNFIVPSWQFSGSISRLLTPILARSTLDKGARLLAWRIFVLLVIFAVTYWILISHFGEYLATAFYGGKYLDSIQILFWFGSISVLRAAVVVMEAWLRAAENPKALAKAYASSVVVSVPVFMYLIYALGPLGAAITMLLTEFLYALFLLVQLRTAKGVQRFTQDP